MANTCIDAGILDQRIKVLYLRKTGAECRWQLRRYSWASADVNMKNKIFSVHGIGSTGVTFTMRRQPLSLDDAILWGGQHCFLTSIVPIDRQYMAVEAALVRIFSCRDPYTGMDFPAIMTEKYARHDQLEPMAINELQRVLITPKEISLTPGKLVEVEGIAWPVLTAHDLDPHKNEFILQRTVDL